MNTQTNQAIPNILGVINISRVRFTRGTVVLNVTISDFTVHAPQDCGIENSSHEPSMLKPGKYMSARLDTVMSGGVLTICGAVTSVLVERTLISTHGDMDKFHQTVRENADVLMSQLELFPSSREA